MQDPSAEWRVDPEAYPVNGSSIERLRFLLRYAILAPSGHNTQPWLFRLAGDGVEVFADRRRGLPVVDPHDRALVISCGAAIAMLRVAMRRFGHEGVVELLPDSKGPDLLARVSFGPGFRPDEADIKLFDAIARRRTTRRPFAGPLPDGLEGKLRDVAERERVKLAFIVDPTTKTAVAELVSDGDHIQFADPGFRRELGAWVHSRRAASRDGMSGANFGMPDLLSGIGGLVIRTFDMGDGIGAKDREIVENSPALLVLATAGDKPGDWLAAGMAHALMLLEIAAAGLTAAYLNQPIEVDRLRPRLGMAAGLSGIPQLVLRVGRGPAVPPAVRRPVAEVMLKADDAFCS